MRSLADEIEGRAEAAVDQLEERWESFGNPVEFDTAMEAVRSAAMESARAAAKPDALRMFCLSHGLLEGLLACIGAAPSASQLNLVRQALPPGLALPIATRGPLPGLQGWRASAGLAIPRGRFIMAMHETGAAITTRESSEGSGQRGLHLPRPAGLCPVHQVRAGPLGRAAHRGAGRHPAAGAGRSPARPAARRWAHAGDVCALG